MIILICLHIVSFAIMVHANSNQLSANWKETIKKAHSLTSSQIHTTALETHASKMLDTFLMTHFLMPTSWKDLYVQVLPDFLNRPDTVLLGMNGNCPFC